MGDERSIFVGIVLVLGQPECASKEQEIYHSSLCASEEVRISDANAAGFGRICIARFHKVDVYQLREK